MFCLSGIYFTSMVHIHSWPGPYFYSHILEDFRVIVLGVKNFIVKNRWYQLKPHLE